MSIRHVTLVGAGVLGAQIAFQTAFKGFDVSAYVPDQAALDKAGKVIGWLQRRYLQDIDGADPQALAAAAGRIRWTTDLAAAVKDADLVIEAIPEQLELKRRVYAELGRLAPATAIFATNSSTLLPSAMADATGRPERFIALHFANEIWLHNVAEVMGHAGTDPEVFSTLVRFANDIGMVPVEIHKEKAGYVLNSLLVPLMSAASELLVDGIAEHEAIDRTWKIATGSPRGPFEIYDIVGLGTAYHISLAGGPKQQAFARLLKERYIDHGKLGVETGEGFYRYES
ncbi:3-hydroxybutyryl-CoA dehydrogenase [Bordetella bronchiseptica E014]|uniref:3-hydroxyacyl-CoA dehydrogenase n=1 Tax=Pseudomonadota TaxID=1224 RepID=UPI00049F5151|nr:MULTISPECIES: 3-hydroxyacyl-CoA dehydrogenase [Pseudomonadota]MBP7656305.1 3-hydroxyacyl-CoA dehydrogenase [Pseudoxanthomonas sp.]ASI67786.1 3-hydroxybutyryl-CoA dehydrogenase [Diaphorobacter nitroreducens]KDC22909.1 3-hydroxybutyryl-CoA dehydrogenase [Bordetella bronchiseptica E014]MBA0271990.1 3-hydroxyacyl-CoA dehydrogenase [Stenotrophomonas maltophilia]MDT3491161.1 3-hydroxyacyl-CoA dehydrogenase [Stenotrophomonas maltophilia group sp. msm4]